jgi:membrane protease YdiL (CAAX protease family)
MPTDPAQAVLRDFENLAWLTLVLGLVLYGAWRFFFPARADRLPDPAEPPADAPAAPESAPAGLEVRHFSGADLVILPLVLIKYSVTLQLLAATVSAYPGKLAEKFGFGTAAPAGPVAEPTAVEMTPVLIVFDLLLNVILISLVIVMIQWVGQRNVLRVFGLTRLGPLRLALWVLAGSIVVTPVVLLLSMGIPEMLEPIFGKDIDEQAAVMNIRESGNLAFKLLLIFNAVLVAPLVEEIVFRGYFYGVMKRHTSAMFAAFITGAIFAAAHQNILALLPLWGLAMFLTLFYEASRSLWVPIGMHAAFNAVNVALILIGFGDP